MPETESDTYPPPFNPPRETLPQAGSGEGQSSPITTQEKRVEQQDDKHKHVGKLVIVHGEDGAKYPALVLGGYEGADYVNLLVFIDPQSAGHSPTVGGHYLIQVSPGTGPGQFSEV